MKIFFQNIETEEKTVDGEVLGELDQVSIFRFFSIFPHGIPTPSIFQCFFARKLNLSDRKNEMTFVLKTNCDQNCDQNSQSS